MPFNVKVGFKYWIVNDRLLYYTTFLHHAPRYAFSDLMPMTYWPETGNRKLVPESGTSCRISGTRNVVPETNYCENKTKQVSQFDHLSSSLLQNNLNNLNNLEYIYARMIKTTRTKSKQQQWPIRRHYNDHVITRF